MMVSTKGRYALRVMIDLCEHNDGKYIPLKDIAARQEISKKYLEGIMTSLSKAGLIIGLHGKGGGYKLNIDPESCTVLAILEATEKAMVPVACLAEGAEPCPRAAECKTLPMWSELSKRIREYLTSVTLQDLIQEEDVGDYVI